MSTGNTPFPAPWSVQESDTEPGKHLLLAADGTGIAILYDRTVANRICLEHNAFDVKRRRGWSADPDMDRWCVGPAYALPEKMLGMRWDCPALALVEAEAWHVANETQEESR